MYIGIGLQKYINYILNMLIFFKYLKKQVKSRGKNSIFAEYI